MKSFLSKTSILIVSALVTNMAFAEVPIETGIIDAFATLKVSTYALLVIAIVIGTTVSIYRYKRGLPSLWIGLAISTVLTIVFFEASAWAVLDDTAKVCWVMTDANDQLISPCAQGRESLANLIGLKSIYTTISPRQILETGIAEPIGPIAIKFMIYFSLVFVAIGVTRLLQIVTKK